MKHCDGVFASGALRVLLRDNDGEGHRFGPNQGSVAWQQRWCVLETSSLIMYSSSDMTYDEDTIIFALSSCSRCFKLDSSRLAELRGAGSSFSSALLSLSSVPQYCGFLLEMKDEFDNEGDDEDNEELDSRFPLLRIDCADSSRVDHGPWPRVLCFCAATGTEAETWVAAAALAVGIEATNEVWESSESEEESDSESPGEEPTASRILAVDIDDFSDYEDDSNTRRSSLTDNMTMDWSKLAAVVPKLEEKPTKLKTLRIRKVCFDQRNGEPEGGLPDCPIDDFSDYEDDRMARSSSLERTVETDWTFVSSSAEPTSSGDGTRDRSGCVPDLVGFHACEVSRDSQGSDVGSMLKSTVGTGDVFVGNDKHGSERVGRIIELPAESW